ncbi:MAG: histidine kinase [Microscillaceae bacterium]|nr:histidine kinase [Microscillaceae bacterium]
MKISLVYTIFYHILFWLAYGLFWAIIFAQDLSPQNQFEFSREHGIFILILVIVQIISAYLTVFLLIPRLLYQNHYLWFGLSYFVMLEAGARMILAGLQPAVCLFPNDMIAHYFNRWDYQITAGYLITVFSTTLLASGRVILDRFQSEKRNRVLEKEKFETELKFLKAQINPHFLFNTINSIFHLIDKNPAQAQEMLAKFSEMLRYQLYETGTDKIPLAHELAYIRNYAEMEKIRKGKNIEIELQLPDYQLDIEIMPLLLLTFVENAFKHISNFYDKKNWIKIELKIENECLYFNVENSKENHNRLIDNNLGGVGLVNLQKRLALSYPNQYDLKIRNEASIYRVDLVLQTSKSQKIPIAQTFLGN